MPTAFNNSAKLRIIVLLGGIGGTALVGFGVYRALTGAWVQAALDIFIGVGLLGLVAYTWRTGDTLRGGIVLCLFSTVGCALAAWVVGPVLLHWLPFTLTANFFLTTPRVASILGIALIALFLVVPGMYSEPAQAVLVTVVSGLMTLSGYLFTTQVTDERTNLEAMASLDTLTGVANRRSMEQALEMALRSREAGDAHYGLVMLDLDHFKAVNDTFGHAAGDAVLADLASILKVEMRRNDTVFRFGGEEFVVLVELSSTEELKAIAERLRQAVHMRLRGPGGRITVSLGAAMLGTEANWQEWFLLADTALYQAKNTGRDRAVVHVAEA